jgi:hypothetical protein
MKIFNWDVTFKITPCRKKSPSEKTFLKIMDLAEKLTQEHLKECGDYLLAVYAANKRK